jgi:hypothetical protein
MNFSHNSLFFGIDSNQVPPEIEAMLFGNAELKTLSLWGVLFLQINAG